MPDHDFPEPFRARISQQLGARDNAFFQALAAPPTLAIRLNRRKPTQAFAQEKAVPWCSSARYLAERPIFAIDPLWHGGAYYVQEPASLLLDFALRTFASPLTPTRVLDLCAAPGGKSTLLADFLPDDALLVANEVIRTREPILRENLTRWGSPNLVITNHDPADFAPLTAFFDLLVVDAPCSGEGLFRKEPDSRRQWSEKTATLCAARQRRILAEAIPLVRPGGLLLYSTCTFNPAENDAAIDTVLATQDWEALRLPVPESWGMHATDHGIQCWPHECQGEGFYLAVLRRLGDSPPYASPPARSEQLTAVEQDAITRLLHAPDTFRFTRRPATGEVVGIPANLMDDVLFLSQTLRRQHSGVTIGTQKGKDFVPSHAIALSTACSPRVVSIPVDRDDALQFLRKAEMSLPVTPDPGWARITFHDVALGWVKCMPGRINNYLPAEWRLRTL